MPNTRGAALRAILFTDIVGSTELARELGDERWGRLLAAELRILRDLLKRHHGREVDTAGDGMFAVFGSPADAVRCAFAACRDVQGLGLDVRAGVHFGEIETSGKDVHGIVVHTGARVMAQAGAAEVLVTQTVRDLVAGATFRLTERGTFELKGVPGPWALYDVLEVDGDLRPEGIEGATVASERRERASARPPARTRRGWLPAALAAAVVLAAAAYVVFRPQPTFVPGPGTVARIAGERFDRPIPVGSFPLALSEGDGRVWVLDRQSQVYWVDEGDGATGSRGTDGVPTGVAVGDGSVWITAGFGSSGSPGTTVSRLDPANGQLTAAFETAIGSQAIAYGKDAVWVAEPGTSTITRFDPVSRAAQEIALPTSEDAPRPDSLAIGSAVWAGDTIAPQVYRVDPSGTVRTFTIGGPPTALAVDANTVWVVSERADAVYALDPATGSVRTTIDVGADMCNGPVSVALNTEGVWVACGLSQRLVELDPSGSGVLASLPVHGAPVALTTAGDGSVWVAVQPR